MNAVRYLALMMALVCMLVCVCACGSDEPSSTATEPSKTDITSMDGITTSTQETMNSTEDTTVSSTTADVVGTEPTSSLATTPSQGTTVTGGKGTSTNATTTTTTTTTTKAAVTTTKGNSGTSATPVKLTPISADAYYGYRYVAAKGEHFASAYKLVANGIGEMRAKISFEDVGITVSKAELATIMDCYRADYPQHFWYNGAYRYVMDSSDTILTIEPTYTMTAAQKETAQQKLDAEIDRMLEKASYGKTAYDRELILHDALAEQITYVDGTNAHNMYGALVEKKAVCEGYARAFQYLMYCSGTQCLMVEGMSVRPGGTKGESHAWNIVEIDGKYYHVDVTWDDQTGADVPVVHAFFNLTTALIEEGHDIASDNPYPIPSCTATAAAYYVVEGTELKTLTVDALAKRFKAGNGTATVFLSGNTVNELVSFFQKNISAIAGQAGLHGKTFTLQYCGREVIIIAK